MRLGAPTSRTRFRARLAPFDVGWALIAPFVALELREPRLIEGVATLSLPPEAWAYAGITAVCALPALLLFRLANSVTRIFSVHELAAVCRASAFAAATSAALTFAFDSLDSVPRSTPLIYFAVLVCGFSGARLAAAWRASRETDPTEPAAAFRLRRVVLVGVDRFSSQAIRLLDYQSPRTVQIVAALDSREDLIGGTVEGVRIVGAPADLPAVIEEYEVHGVAVDEVWALDDVMANFQEASIIHRVCADARVKVSALSQALNLTPAGAHLREAAPRTSPAVPRYLRFRRVADALAASALLCLLAPIGALVALLVLFDVGAPVIFWQERIGRRGAKFLLYKFRTFRAPFDRWGDAVPPGARLSKIGKAIRATRLDEIPQLVNIIRGDMAVIGPRPLLPVDQPADPQTRLSVSPGVTGWAQVNGGTFVSPEEKDALDVWYIRHASLALDFAVVWRTFAYFFRGERRHEAAIEEAQRWRGRLAEIDAPMFRGPEAPPPKSFASAEYEPMSNRGG